MSSNKKQIKKVFSKEQDSGTSFIGKKEGKIETRKIEEFKNVWMPDNEKQFVRKNKKVILLGTAGTLGITPWDQKDVDYWACAPVMTYKETEGHRLDLLFEMHFMEYWVQVIDRLNGYTVKHPNTYI